MDIIEYLESYDNFYIELKNANEVLVYHTFNKEHPTNYECELFTAAISDEDFKELKENGTNAECLKKISENALFKDITDYVGGAGGRPSIIEEIASNTKYRALMEEVHKNGDTEHITNYMIYGGAYGIYNTDLLNYLGNDSGDYYEAFIEKTGNDFTNMCVLYFYFDEGDYEKPFPLEQSKNGRKNAQIEKD